MVLAETERECASVLAKKLFGICERSGRGEEKLQAFVAFFVRSGFCFYLFLYLFCNKDGLLQILRSLCGTLMNRLLKLRG
jgi:hypothetical protein